MAISPDLPQPIAGATIAATRDQLLLAAWRKIVVGQVDCPVLALELGAACGADASATFGVIMTFVTAFAYAGRRRLRVGFPGCPGITRDEHQLLDLVAAAQDGSDAAVEAHLRWLTRHDRRAAVVTATAALAAELTARGLMPPQLSATAAPDRGCVLCLYAGEAAGVPALLARAP